jgi:hypothetical protein
MFKTVEDNEATIASAWARAAEDIQRAFESGA